MLFRTRVPLQWISEAEGAARAAVPLLERWSNWPRLAHTCAISAGLTLKNITRITAT